MSGGAERRDCPPQEWYALHQQLRDEGFAFFDFLTAVDETDRDEGGLDVVSHLYDVTPGALRSVLVRTRVPETEPLRSLTTLWRGAAWHERETHEMFGQDFDGFVDGTGLGLRPLLLPDGFEGTPLRKSFVLASRATRPWPGGKEPGEGHSSKSPSRRRVTAPGVPGPEWGQG